MNESTTHTEGNATDAARVGSRRARLFDALSLFARGIAMGAADIVPGVSGGTIALITGIYERMIDALGTLSPMFVVPLVRGQPRAALARFMEMKWIVILPLFSGVLLSDVLMSQIIPKLMDDHPGEMYAFFFGLIAAAVWIPFALMRARSIKHYVVVVLAAAGAWLFVGLQPEGVRLEVISQDTGATTVVYPNKLRSAADFTSIEVMALEVTDGAVGQIVVLDPHHLSAEENSQPVEYKTIILADHEALDEWLVDAPPLIVLVEKRSTLPWVFVFGVIAISAMILPGLSGAFLLLFFGQYHALLSSIHGVAAPLVNLISGHPGAAAALGARPWIDDALFLAMFNVGVILGLATFSRAVRWLLHHIHDVTMAALTGLMIGALRQPATVVLQVSERSESGYWMIVSAAVIVGAVIVLSLHWLDTRLAARRSNAG